MWSLLNTNKDAILSTASTAYNLYQGHEALNDNVITSDVIYRLKHNSFLHYNIRTALG